MLPILFTLAGLTPSQTPPHFAATVASSSEPILGTLTKLDPSFGVRWTGSTPTVAPDDLLSLVRTDKPRPAFPTGPFVLLANGDRIAGRVTGGSKLAVKISTVLGNGQSASFPLTGVAAIWFVPPTAETPPDVARYSWVDSGKKRDALLFRNGDSLHGRLESISTEGDGLRFKPDGEAAAKPYEMSALAALVLDPTLARIRPPKDAFARVTTADGSRVSFTSLLSNGSILTGTTVTGAKLSLPLEELIAVDIRQGKAVDLTELKPASVKEEAFNTVTWPWKSNRSVRGNPLRLSTARGEEVFDSGLGVHSKTTLTYTLGGKYKRFEAMVGLDATSGRRGAVDVRVLVDGKEAKLDGVTGLTARAGAQAIRVDVTKAKELTLVVDFGPGGDVQDDVNWVNPRLVE